jgi:hypothetical protein
MLLVVAVDLLIQQEHLVVLVVLVAVVLVVLVQMEEMA